MTEQNGKGWAARPLLRSGRADDRPGDPLLAASEVSALAFCRLLERGRGSPSPARRPAARLPQAGG